MWCKLTSQVSNENIDALLGRADVIVSSRLAESMRFVELAKGEAVAFDSFEPHMSGPNATLEPRLAMKIAYAEGRDKMRYLTRTDALERSA